MTRVVYLTVDSIAEGIGASQVLRYVERLPAHGVDVELVSFEKQTPAEETRARLAAAGVRWRPLPFGRHGPLGGVGRVLRGAWAVRRAPLVHARSDLAAASAMLAGRRRWIWDVRSFWADELLEMGRMRPRGAAERVMRFIEGRAARTSSGVVTLAAAAVPILELRHGAEVARKVEVITTCVDLDRFAPAPAPARPPLVLLLSGTLNHLYDVPRMVEVVVATRERTETSFEVLKPIPSPWDPDLTAAGASIDSARPDEMPERIRSSHVGLSLWRPEAGLALKAATPTKLGEFLATGRPVVVNPGLGDMDKIIATHRCGVVVPEGPDGVAQAVEALLPLLEDPDLPRRCREAAEANFDLADGIRRLVGIYERASSSR